MLQKQTTPTSQQARTTKGYFSFILHVSTGQQGQHCSWLSLPQSSEQPPPGAPCGLQFPREKRRRWAAPGLNFYPPFAGRSKSHTVHHVLQRKQSWNIREQPHSHTETAFLSSLREVTQIPTQSQHDSQRETPQAWRVVWSLASHFLSPPRVQMPKF